MSKRMKKNTFSKSIYYICIFCFPFIYLFLFKSSF